MADKEATTGRSGGDDSSSGGENAARHDGRSGGDRPSGRDEHVARHHDRSGGDGSAGRDEDAAGGDSREGGHPPASGRGGNLTAARAARLGLRQIVELTGRHADGVTGVEPSDDGWIVDVEVVEDSRVPSSTDILAIYQTELDHSGELISYRRVKRYRRSQAESDSGGESW